jgi:hypothetical protein
MAFLPATTPRIIMHSRRSRWKRCPIFSEALTRLRRPYRDRMLSSGQYLGQLYDIGFDVPESHVIGKDQTLYYAFFAKQQSPSSAETAPLPMPQSRYFNAIQAQFPETPLPLRRLKIRCRERREL